MLYVCMHGVYVRAILCVCMYGVYVHVHVCYVHTCICSDVLDKRPVMLEFEKRYGPASS